MSGARAGGGWPVELTIRVVLLWSRKRRLVPDLREKATMAGKRAGTAVEAGNRGGEGSAVKDKRRASGCESPRGGGRPIKLTRPCPPVVGGVATASDLREKAAMVRERGDMAGRPRRRGRRGQWRG
uniref:DUF834 domain-containing protein n=1 Tax=Oryza rufipogon TaxID=4529 RepID=A0A0E0Q129_ORYRU